jgi:hypothetical protein
MGIVWLGGCFVVSLGVASNVIRSYGEPAKQVATLERDFDE